MKIKHLFSLLFVMLFASCELYFDDEPVADNSMDAAKEAPVTVKNEYGEYTYKLKPDVHTIEIEKYRDYIIGGQDSTFYFSISTPVDFLPKAGENLVAMCSDVFPRGLANYVTSVTEENGMFVVRTKGAMIEDIYEDLEISMHDIQLANPELENDTTTRADKDEDVYDEGGAGERKKVGGFDLNFNLEGKQMDLPAGGGVSGISIKYSSYSTIGFDFSYFGKTLTYTNVTEDILEIIANVEYAPNLAEDEIKKLKDDSTIKSRAIRPRLLLR